MLEINEQISIPDAELSWSFVRSGGPGGQNVNKVASKAVLRWTLQTNTSLPDEVKLRLSGQQRRRITTEGEMVLTSQRYRDQDRNRQDCLEKLRGFVLAALEVPRPRKATRPSRGAKLRRLGDKRRRSETKAARRSPGEEH
jgi:ribosome-associated protein